MFVFGTDPNATSGDSQVTEVGTDVGLNITHFVAAI